MATASVSIPTDVAKSVEVIDLPISTSIEAEQTTTTIASTKAADAEIFTNIAPSNIETSLSYGTPSDTVIIYSPSTTCSLGNESIGNVFGNDFVAFDLRGVAGYEMGDTSNKNRERRPIKPIQKVQKIEWTTISGHSKRPVVIVVQHTKIPRELIFF